MFEEQIVWKEMIKGLYTLDGSVKIGLAYTSFQGDRLHHSNRTSINPSANTDYADDILLQNNKLYGHVLTELAPIVNNDRW
jgi:hypothetical protein